MNTNTDDLRRKAFLQAAKIQAKQLSSETEKLALSEVEKDPHDPRAWVHLASCYMSDGDFQKAIEPLEKAHSMKPPAPSREWLLMVAEFGAYYQELCKVQSAMGRRPEGRERLEKLLSDMATFPSEKLDSVNSEIELTYSKPAKEPAKKTWWKFWK